jgi:hypothetical protein
MTLSELIDHLQAADRGSGFFDEMIEMRLFGGELVESYHTKLGPIAERVVFRDGKVVVGPALPYTTSVDAALGLLGDENQLGLELYRDGSAEVVVPGMRWFGGRTLPLAICAAAVAKRAK